MKTITEQIRRFDAIDGTFYLINRPDGSLLGKTYSQADAELLASAPMLKAQVAQLRAALAECVTEDGAYCLAYGSDTPKLRTRIAAISNTARAALAQTAGQIGGEK